MTTPKTGGLTNVHGTYTYDDYKRGYREGYQDGMEYARKLYGPVFPAGQELPNVSYTGCKVCGMEFGKPMGYVCPRYECPTKVSC